MARLPLLSLFLLLNPLIAEVEISDRDENPTIRWIQEGETRFQYTFEKPQHIYKAEPSPSGDYFAIWHMDYPPRNLKIFRMVDGLPIADIIPGFGGSLLWTEGDLLLHAWGCGTNCQGIQVISPSGEILHGETVSGHLLTPHGFYLVFPSLAAAPNQDLVMVDARTGERTTLINNLPHPPDDYQLDGNTLRVEFDSNDIRRIELR